MNKRFLYKTSGCQSMQGGMWLSNKTTLLSLHVAPIENNTRNCNLHNNVCLEKIVFIGTIKARS